MLYIKDNLHLLFIDCSFVVHLKLKYYGPSYLFISYIITFL